jgi:actin-related protein
VREGVYTNFLLQSIVKTIPGMKPLVNASGEEVQCIPEMVIESVNQTDVDLHKELLSGVILTGDESSNPYFLHDCFAGYFKQC